MDDWLAARAKISPQALALIIGVRQWTYAELNTLVSGVATHLEKLVHTGQHVGVLLPNSLIYVCLIHALARIGIVLVPLNTRLTTLELEWQLDHSECTLLVVSEQMKQKASELAGDNRHLILAEELLDQAKGESRNLQYVFELNKEQGIVFTSGTTGRSKGAVLTFTNHFWSATASAFRLGVEKNDRWLSCLPLYHVGGLAVIFRSCLYGTAIVLHDRFEEQAISHSLDCQEITLISLVPTMVVRLLNYRKDQPWPSHLRHLLLGGAAASEELYARCKELDIPVSSTYGLTEASSQVATMLPDQTRLKPGSAGKPLMFTSVQIVDDHGQDVPNGKLGELVVKGPTIMVGYFNDPQATATTLRNGYLRTGDIGYLDEDGDLWLVQRRNDIIISGGENVYPAEVERVLQRHPIVAAACVVGIPNQEWGQRVAALVIRHKDRIMTSDELLAFCRQNLASYKLPKILKFVDHFPQTASGKIHRQAVADQLERHTQESPSVQNENLSGLG